MKKYLVLSMTLAVLSSPAFAQMTEEDDCDESTQDCSASEIKEGNTGIYPVKPLEIKHIDTRVKLLTENPNYLRNVREMEARGLNKRNTHQQPWGGSYWPLAQGMAANTYQDKNYTTFITSAVKHLSWRKNVNDFKKRKVNVLPNIMSMSEKELAQLAPSEKYDLLLGDTSFDLTNRIWNYAEKWGEEKKWGFLSAINLPDGYRVPTGNKMMALWEGICHGWAVAAGHAPRPERTVWVTLPSGKRMPFYPNDVKALVSLMWAHSTVQSNVMFEGNRCNRKHPDQDKHGRYIDTKIDKDDTELLPRCADVHPGIFHLSIINILGIEGRSFVLDKNPAAPISNQPVAGYEIEYFNPKTGSEGALYKSIISVGTYGKKDKYAANRHPKTTHIVGVAMKLKYTDWEHPKKKETNSPKDDKISDFDFKYDLELDSEGNIIGGQWRVGKKIGDTLGMGKTHQPDFFWVIPRDYKQYFKPVEGLPTWDLTSGAPAPESYKSAAMTAHGFTYEESKFFFGVSPKCPVFPIAGGDPMKVDCEFRYPKPQPLIQVVDQLLQLSRR
ncbi:MAG TPA: hypothetical protein VNJ08_03155 [Bacteriovoracaceae bacterium]|nr:hypothetical protein [Bacteriovoracaceae bacterium]